MSTPKASSRVSFRAPSKSNVGAGANRSDAGTAAIGPRTDKNSEGSSMSGVESNAGTASSMSGARTGAIIGSVTSGVLASALGGVLVNAKSIDHLTAAKGIGVGTTMGAGFGTGVGTLADKFMRHKMPLNATKRGAIAGALTVAAPMAAVGVLVAGIADPKHLAVGSVVTGVVTGVAAGIGAGAGASIDKFTRYKRDKNKTKGTPQPN